MARTATSSLADQFEDSFDPDVVSHGNDLYRRNRFFNLEGAAHRVRATFTEGSGHHPASLEYDRATRSLNARCDCTYYRFTDMCSHIWGLLKAARDYRYLEDALAHGCHYIEAANLSAPAVDDADAAPAPIPIKRPPQNSPSAPPPEPTWRRELRKVREQMEPPSDTSDVRWPGDRQIVYILDIDESAQGKVALELAVRDVKQNGDWSKPKSNRIEKRHLPHLPEASDRAILSALDGASNSTYGWGFYGSGYRSDRYDTYGNYPSRVYLRDELTRVLIPTIAGTGRCFARRSTEHETELYRVDWDARPWRFQVRVEQPDQTHYHITGALTTGQETMALSQTLLAMRMGLLVSRSSISMFDGGPHFAWFPALVKGPLKVPVRDTAALKETLWSMPALPVLDLPQALRAQELTPAHKPVLRLLRNADRRGGGKIHGHLKHDYEGTQFAHDEPGEGQYDKASQRYLRRSPKAERDAMDQLMKHGFRAGADSGERSLTLPAKLLPSVVTQLAQAGWRVEADGKLYRSAGSIDVSVTSGIDWFELRGAARFDDQSVELPDLLAAIRRGEQSIVLADGSLGMLPSAWLEKYASIADLGEKRDDHIRFKPTQVMLLDAMLAAMPEANCDALFEQTRSKLRGFAGVAPAQAPASFTGELRPYQREGLGWLQFLNEFHFGGCLADDMGLGKTVQVLALLDQRRLERETAAATTPQKKRAGGPPRTSLAVVPRSLIFNWMQEAARFAPKLRVLDHSGIERAGRENDQSLDHVADYDLVLTTYGILRQDIAKLKDLRFDYVILDEAQAIKNANTASAKAVRLLGGDHRLVMTGTPVENRLGDLWSLFEFLNPGMLGSAGVFKLMGGQSASDDARNLLGKAIRPFILRRTKDQVATDLPAKVEQTVYCELEPGQRKMYNDLRDHYRASLMGKVARDGIKKSKIHVLEALLRLRQAALHPALIDPDKHTAPSAKLDALMPQLQEVIDGGHKALVFSQFTTMLGLVRQRLVEANIPFEYLDGQTKDRQECVERFQTNDDCKVFLISLKAGGVGLNLTSAEYVFLLDPWWNPAVESQAIDRAHRIGQCKQVFAYRLIARDTVEEKVLELQNSKRELAEAIISQDNSVLSSIGREELELLLS